MQVEFNDAQYEVVPTHDIRQWYMLVEEVAQAYGVTRQAIMYHLKEHESELREGIEKGDSITDTPGGPQRMTVLFREGVIKLGFFIRSQEAAAFRQFATDLVVQHLENQGVLTADAFSAFVAEQNTRFDRIEQVAGGLRQEVDELKDMLNLFLTDTERDQIQAEINLTKAKLQLDGRTVVGKVRAMLGTSGIYNIGKTAQVINCLRNLRGEGLRPVE